MVFTVAKVTWAVVWVSQTKEYNELFAGEKETIVGEDCFVEYDLSTWFIAVAIAQRHFSCKRTWTNIYKLTSKIVSTVAKSAVKHFLSRKFEKTSQHSFF